MKQSQLQSDISTSLAQSIIIGQTGATFSAGSDCYPYTIVGYKVSKTGLVTIMVTPDDYEWVPDAGYEGKGSENGRGHFKYTSTESKTPGIVKMWTKYSKNWSIGHRRYYHDPHF